MREQFKLRGHDAWSCDLLDTEIQGNHYKGDVFDIINNGWDLMIAHPPCTYLCSSGLHWNKNNNARKIKTEEALDFVKRLLAAPIHKICLENPVGIISTRLFKPSQYIQPYYFGDNASKKTGLWLKNLPILDYHKDNFYPPREVNIKGKIYKRWGNQSDSGENNLPESEHRWKERSRTYLGFAKAMAEQWG